MRTCCDPVRRSAVLGHRQSDARPARARVTTATPTVPPHRSRRSLQQFHRRPRSITGKLTWYYQHLPGDDWDSDYTHETHSSARPSIRIRFVKWINPDNQKGEERDVSGHCRRRRRNLELDRNTGQFLGPIHFLTTSRISYLDIDRRPAAQINWTPGVEETRRTPRHLFGTPRVTGRWLIIPARTRSTYLTSTTAAT